MNAVPGVVGACVAGFRERMVASYADAWQGFHVSMSSSAGGSLTSASRHI